MSRSAKLFRSRRIPLDDDAQGMRTAVILLAAVVVLAAAVVALYSL